MFGDMKDYKNLWLAEQRKNKAIHKQVCDEIKSKLQVEIMQIDDILHCCSQDVVYWQDICSVIDKIKAKESIDEDRFKTR